MAALVLASSKALSVQGRGRGTGIEVYVPLHIL